MFQPEQESTFTMSFSSLFKKASNFLGIGSPESPKHPPLDGEIIFCKNNVCVHPPAVLTSEVQHHPGYLNIRSQDDEVLGATLILTWIPNSTLKKNPRSIENSPSRPSPRISPRRQEYAKSDHTSRSPSLSPKQSTESSSSADQFEERGVCLSDLRRQSKDELSLNSEYSSESHTSQSPEGMMIKDISRDKISISSKSQADSGIEPEDFADIAAAQFLATEVSKLTNAIRAGDDSSTFNNDDENVYRNNKDVDKVQSDSNGVSSESDSPTTDAQLNILLGKKPRNKSCELVKEHRSSSSRSVSIEMDGDNLVVVTEELEDSTFVDEETTLKNGHNTKGNAQSSDELDSISVSSNSTFPSPMGERYITAIRNSQKQEQFNGESTDSDKAQGDGTSCVQTDNIDTRSSSTMEQMRSNLDLKLNLESQNNGINIPTPDISITHEDSLSSCSTPTSGPDSRPPTPFTPPDSLPGSPLTSRHERNSEDYDYSDELDSPSYNMSFPHNSISFSSSSPGYLKKSARDQVCGVFSVDLGQMRSLRLFYSNDSCTSGHLVIASRESQYKILHFHHGGLDRLADVFSEWRFFAEPKMDKALSVISKLKRSREAAKHFKQFSVIRPHLPNNQCHPEEGVYDRVNEETWRQYMNHEGQIMDDYQLRKAVFFGGLDSNIRTEAWPFLLQYYPYNSKFEEREHIRNDKYIEYQNLRKMRESMSEKEQEEFWRNIQSTVEKDVVRTDRSHPYFKGEDNPNLEILKNILLNYAVVNPYPGYTQGMSDLLAPVLAEVQNEVDSYWCFTGLMQRTIFVSSPKDIDMDRQLNYLRELLRVMLPHFYSHLIKLGDAMDLLFCHRWILLCFKREFPEHDALRMWEACWAHYQSDFFHLFICVAIISVYGEDVVQDNLPSDEMLLHFSSLSMHMSGDVVLRKARGLLHQFRTLSKIPCTLEGLCMLCGPGMWDSGHVPTVECTGDHEGGVCLHGGTV